jgi:hypothetical protein
MPNQINASTSQTNYSELMNPLNNERDTETEINDNISQTNEDINNISTSENKKPIFIMNMENIPMIKDSAPDNLQTDIQGISQIFTQSILHDIDLKKCSKKYIPKKYIDNIIKQTQEKIPKSLNTYNFYSQLLFFIAEDCKKNKDNFSSDEQNLLAQIFYYFCNKDYQKILTLESIKENIEKPEIKNIDSSSLNKREEWINSLSPEKDEYPYTTSKKIELELEQLKDASESKNVNIKLLKEQYKSLYKIHNDYKGIIKENSKKQKEEQIQKIEKIKLQNTNNSTQELKDSKKNRVMLYMNIVNNEEQSQKYPYSTRAILLKNIKEINEQLKNNININSLEKDKKDKIIKTYKKEKGKYEETLKIYDSIIVENNKQESLKKEENINEKLVKAKKSYQSKNLKEYKNSSKFSIGNLYNEEVSQYYTHNLETTSLKEKIIIIDIMTPAMYETKSGIVEEGVMKCLEISNPHYNSIQKIKLYIDALQKRKTTNINTLEKKLKDSIENENECFVFEKLLKKSINNKIKESIKEKVQKVIQEEVKKTQEEVKKIQEKGPEETPQETEKTYEEMKKEMKKKTPQEIEKTYEEMKEETYEEIAKKLHEIKRLIYLMPEYQDYEKILSIETMIKKNKEKIEKLDLILEKKDTMKASFISKIEKQKKDAIDFIEENSDKGLIFSKELIKKNKEKIRVYNKLIKLKK